MQEGIPQTKTVLLQNVDIQCEMEMLEFFGDLHFLFWSEINGQPVKIGCEWHSKCVDLAKI